MGSTISSGRVGVDIFSRGDKGRRYAALLLKNSSKYRCLKREL